MQKKAFNIAIDGPAGAGKSTIAKMVAKKLGFIYVDTGAMYRAIALYMLRQGVDRTDEAAVSEAVKGAKITIRYQDGAQQVLLNGEDVSGLIRTEEVGNTASATSVYPAVRAHLLALQRELAASADVLMDGRDIGTCILPDADAKIFLTASARVRAMRRYKELLEKGEACNLEEIEQDIMERDARDMNREIAPLKQAADALLVDSSEMTIEQVVQAIIDAAVSKGLPAGRVQEGC
ncbi:MAG: (d)CMP kinase [Eubacteriales bacterium]|nr:(d)CMP kinase [Eubacteriales bacterium]